MRVETILRNKGSDVTAVRPTDTIADCAKLSADQQIGAALVREGDGIRGVISERDIVRGVAKSGGKCLDQQVSALMTRDVVTCSPHDTIDAIMALMTEERIRHVPVVNDGKVAGIISIGDVVKHRIEEIEYEARALKQYIATG